MAADLGVRIVGFTPPRKAALTRGLEALLDRPLSRKLIADAVAVVTRSYRAANRPFVSVTTPPQDLTGGMLRLRVVEFTAGLFRVRAADRAVAAAVARGVRFPAGQRIDALRLRQDLAWLDRYPFRRTDAVFGPGAKPGTTDLTATAVSARPWQGFAGVARSDAPSSGEVRVYGGVVAGELLGSGSLVSVQATASGLDDPRYWSVAARMIEPIGPRREVSLFVAHVRGRTVAVPFASRADTTEVAFDLRFALPPGLLGDAHLGIEAGRQRIGARFGGLPVYDVQATTFAAVARYSVAAPVAAATLSGEIAVHLSPGGVGRANTAERLFFGRPRAGSATYAFLTADVAVEQVMSKSLTWQGRAIIQAAGTPLPGINQIGLGGSAYVRGYTLDDGGYDSAVIVRNALRVGRRGAAPYIFTDWGYGRDQAARRAATIGSAGAGVAHALGRGLRVLAEAAMPLLDERRTAAGHPRLFGRVDLAF